MQVENSELATRFRTLTTAHLADGCLLAGVPVRCAPAGTRAAHPGWRVAGRVLPARHCGSVDVFLEAISRAEPGDVLVADNGGRLTESCIGDLVALEAREAHLAGIVIWGLHRDSADIAAIGLPVFSLGSIPTGPLIASDRPEGALDTAMVGEWLVTRYDMVAADEDGALFFPVDRAAEIVSHAESIRDAERAQAALMAGSAAGGAVGGAAGSRSLREQVGFDAYLAARALNPALTFREHLRSVGGEVEV